MKKRIGKKMNRLNTENKNLKSKIVKDLKKEIVEETKEDIKRVNHSQMKLDKLYRKDIKERRFELKRVSDSISKRQDRVEKQIRNIVIALTMQTFLICGIVWKLIL